MKFLRASCTHDFKVQLLEPACRVPSCSPFPASPSAACLAFKALCTCCDKLYTMSGTRQVWSQSSWQYCTAIKRSPKNVILSSALLLVRETRLRRVPALSGEVAVGLGADFSVLLLVESWGLLLVWRLWIRAVFPVQLSPTTQTTLLRSSACCIWV